MLKTKNVEYTKAYKKLLNWLVYAIFIVPKSQIKIFDLPYQLYTFELFHKKSANRWSHFIGIPLNLIALYCIFLPQNTYMAVGVLLIVFGHHFILSLKYKLYIIVPLLITCHTILWLLSVYVFEPFLFNREVWYLSPTFHFLFWPFVQYITHSLESYIPKPWSVSGNWSKLPVILRESKWYIPLLLILMIPLHTFVELISSWRNLYIEILGLAQKASYHTPNLEAINQWVTKEKNSDNPIYDYHKFEENFTLYYDEYLHKKKR